MFLMHSAQPLSSQHKGKNPVFRNARIYGHTCLHFSAMDVWARMSMKGAAKCDERCELQNSVNQQDLERMLRSWDIPESLPVSESEQFSACESMRPRRTISLCVSARQRVLLALKAYGLSILISCNSLLRIARVFFLNVRSLNCVLAVRIDLAQLFSAASS